MRMPSQKSGSTTTNQQGCGDDGGRWEKSKKHVRQDLLTKPDKERLFDLEYQRWVFAKSELLAIAFIGVGTNRFSLSKSKRDATRWQQGTTTVKDPVCDLFPRSKFWRKFLIFVWDFGKMKEKNPNDLPPALPRGTLLKPLVQTNPFSNLTLPSCWKYPHVHGVSCIRVTHCEHNNCPWQPLEAFSPPTTLDAAKKEWMFQCFCPQQEDNTKQMLLHPLRECQMHSHSISFCFVNSICAMIANANVLSTKHATTICCFKRSITFHAVAKSKLHRNNKTNLVIHQTRWQPSILSWDLSCPLTIS